MDSIIIIIITRTVFIMKDTKTVSQGRYNIQLNVSFVHVILTKQIVSTNTENVLTIFTITLHGFVLPSCNSFYLALN
jgi:hypothetical protein